VPIQCPLHPALGLHPYFKYAHCKDVVRDPWVINLHPFTPPVDLQCSFCYNLVGILTWWLYKPTIRPTWVVYVSILGVYPRLHKTPQGLGRRKSWSSSSIKYWKVLREAIISRTGRSVFQRRRDEGETQGRLLTVTADVHQCSSTHMISSPTTAHINTIPGPPRSDTLFN